MVEVSRKWITPKGTLLDGQEVVTVRHELEAIPIAMAMLASIERVHHALLVLYKKPDIPTGLPELKQEARRTDAHFDHLFRGEYWLLTALSELVTDVELSEQLIALREHLFPEGLSTINLPHRREAGFAAMLEGRLEEAHAKLLESIQLQVGGALTTNALTLLQELIVQGKRLGALEDAKEKLLKPEVEPIADANLRDLRNQWIKHAKGLESNLTTFANLPEELEKKILGPLREAESQATERARLQAVKAEKAANTPPKEEGSK